MRGREGEDRRQVGRSPLSAATGPPAASQAPHFWFIPQSSQKGTCKPHLGVLSRIWDALQGPERAL